MPLITDTINKVFDKASVHKEINQSEACNMG